MTGSVDGSFVGPEAYIILVTLLRKKKEYKNIFANFTKHKTM